MEQIFPGNPISAWTGTLIAFAFVMVSLESIPNFNIVGIFTPNRAFNVSVRELPGGQAVNPTPLPLITPESSF